MAEGTKDVSQAQYRTDMKPADTVLIVNSETKEVQQVSVDKFNKPIEFNSAAEMRAMDDATIEMIKNGVVKGVKLNGYYQADDIPNPIMFFLSDTTNEDDGISIFEIGDIKLEHNYVDEISVIDEEIIQKALDISTNKELVINFNKNIDLDTSNVNVKNSILNFNKTVDNGILSSSGYPKYINPKLGRNLKLRNTTSLATINFNILEAMPSFFTQNTDGYWVGLSDAINTFINNIKYNNMSLMSGIKIFIPAGNYYVDNTIKIPRNVSVIGTPRTYLDLRMTNDLIGILLDENLTFDTGGQTWDGYGIGRAEINMLNFRVGTDNKYTIIKEYRGAHHIKNISFPKGSKYHLISNENYSSDIQLYGDGRQIYGLTFSDDTRDTNYKVYINNGDAQTIQQIRGDVKMLIVGSTGMRIIDTIQTDITLWDCRHVTVINMHNEKAVTRVYGSKVTFIGCLLGNAYEHRNVFCNNLEIDTFRIYQDIISSGIVSGVDSKGNDLLSYQVPNKSTVKLINCDFIGLDYAVNKSIPDNANEYWNIYVDLNGGSVDLDGCRYIPNYLSISRNGIGVIPTCNRIDKTNYSYLQLNVPRVTIDNSPFSLIVNSVTNNTTDLPVGTYYYKCILFTDLQRGLGISSDEVVGYVTASSCPQISISPIYKKGVKVAIYRGTSPGVYTDWCVFEMAQNPNTLSYDKNGNYAVANTLIGTDSATNIAGIKYNKNIIRNSVVPCLDVIKENYNNIKATVQGSITSTSVIMYNSVLGDRYIINGKLYEYKSENTVENISSRRVGTTSQRPTLDNWADRGFEYLDLQLTPSRPIWWTGSSWVDGSGTPV